MLIYGDSCCMTNENFEYKCHQMFSINNNCFESKEHNTTFYLEKKNEHAYNKFPSTRLKTNSKITAILAYSCLLGFHLMKDCGKLILMKTIITQFCVMQYLYGKFLLIILNSYFQKYFKAIL